MGSKERKIERSLQEQDIKGLTREISSLMASGSEGKGADVAEVGDFKKIKMVLKREESGFSLKLKVKTSEPEGTQAEGGEGGEEQAGGGDDDEEAERRREYKHLKKRMKSEFELIKSAVKGGRMPAPEAMKGFVRDAQAMCSFRGYGDEHHADFASAVEALHTSFAGGDADGFVAGVDRIGALKHQCHERYR